MRTATSSERADSRLTYEDYCALPEDGRRYQLFEGELDVTPAPSTTHQRASHRLGFLLTEYLDEHRLGEILPAPIDVILADDTVVQPDLVFVSRERKDIVTQRGIEGPPDLVIEVLSPGTRSVDRTTKLNLYDKFGVAEYWLVDPEARTIEVFTRSEGTLAFANSASDGASLTTERFPGLTLSLDAVFARCP